LIKLYDNFYPDVSVILTAYNRRNFLKRSIESGLNQTVKNIELIIIDDGSSDDTFTLVNSYVMKYDNIRYIKHKNKKLPLTENAGIALSSGKFISFLGSDDEYEPQHLELRLNFMNLHPDIDMIHGGLKIIGNPYVKDFYDNTKLIHVKDCYVGGTFFGKRKVFFELNGFANIPYSEDRELIERAGKIFKIQKVDFPTYIYYRNTEGSITNSI
jgi:glycosyltransferase involved in cell wall biosynthesis